MATTKPTQSMAAFVDQLLFSGITWESLATRVERESKRRELKTPYSVKTHLAYRTKILGWTFEESETGVRGLPPTKPEKAKAAKKSAAAKAKPAPKAKAKPATTKAKPAPKKNGKPTGRRVAKTKENGRQQVVDASVNIPIAAQRDDSTSEPV